MKNKVFAVVALAALLAMGRFAQAEESDVSASLDLPVLSAYVWRGQVLNDEQVVQPSLTVSKGGFAINWWGSIALTDNQTGDENEFSEHDISVSYTYTCPKTDISATAGIVNYDFPNTALVDTEGNVSLVNDTREAFLILGFPVLLSPTVSVYYDFKEADGFYGSIGVSHSIELADKVSLGLAASIGGADDEWGTFYYVEEQDDNFTDYSVSATIPFAVNDSLTITPGVAYSSLMGDAEDAVDNSGEALYFGETDQVVGSLKASYAF